MAPAPPLSTFQLAACALIAVWLGLVAVRFRRSTAVLVGGLGAVTAYAGIALWLGHTTPGELGLTGLHSFGWAALVSVAWLALMLGYSPVADRVAGYWFHEPPDLRAFRGLKQSRAKLIAGIVIAWVLGGFVEELVLRGIVVRTVAAALQPRAPMWAAASAAVLVAALGAWVLHLYQGLRAALIVAQLSVLFGVLFVLSGYQLLPVILCHGLYDTIAFVRFASGKSRYARVE